MISTKEQVVTGLAELSETQLRQVADFLEFLKFRNRFKHKSHLDDNEIAALYGEFADEDRELAEAGLNEYAADLERADAAQ